MPTSSIGSNQKQGIDRLQIASRSTVTSPSPAIANCHGSTATKASVSPVRSCSAIAMDAPSCWPFRCLWTVSRRGKLDANQFEIAILQFVAVRSTRFFVVGYAHRIGPRQIQHRARSPARYSFSPDGDQMISAVKPRMVGPGSPARIV